MKIDATTVRRLRESQAWSQEQLAAVAGIGVRTVQRVEAEGSASMETCMALAIAFGCLPVDLMRATQRTTDDAAALLGAETDPVETSRSGEAWTTARLNALLYWATTTIVWVGILLGNTLIEPSTRMFDLPVYDAFVLSLTAIFFVSVVSTPAAASWAAERWQWSMRRCALPRDSAS
jgi:transcriptional regulator with XRE-family HTH domain